MTLRRATLVATSKIYPETLLVDSHEAHLQRKVIPQGFPMTEDMAAAPA
jgi:hypothetical protein